MAVERRAQPFENRPKTRIFDPIALPVFPETTLSDTIAPTITLYSTAICPYCVAAKNFLKSKGLGWSEVRIDTDPAARDAMVAKTRRTSVPQIFIGDIHVGGYDDMMALHRAGKLEPLLGGAGA
ncbi:MAG: glutaredoxin 3 [Lysobacteraceae bacterium]|nr:MAG: glutaredoxin 3 [Xanthomonadaceae bacterium]